MSRSYDITTHPRLPHELARAQTMLILTYLPAFITTVLQGIPGIWKGQHRLIRCWLIVMQAIYPGRKTLHELARWSPGQITEWRFRRLLKASYCGRFTCSSNGSPMMSWLSCRHQRRGSSMSLAMAAINPSAPATPRLPKKVETRSTKTGFSGSDSPC